MDNFSSTIDESSALAPAPSPLEVPLSTDDIYPPFRVSVLCSSCLCSPYRCIDVRHAFHDIYTRSLALPSGLSLSCQNVSLFFVMTFRLRITCCKWTSTDAEKIPVGINFHTGPRRSRAGVWDGRGRVYASTAPSPGFPVSLGLTRFLFLVTIDDGILNVSLLLATKPWTSHENCLILSHISSRTLQRWNELSHGYLCQPSRMLEETSHEPHRVRQAQNLQRTTKSFRFLRFKCCKQDSARILLA